MRRSFLILTILAGFSLTSIAQDSLNISMLSSHTGWTKIKDVAFHDNYLYAAAEAGGIIVCSVVTGVIQPLNVITADSPVDEIEVWDDHMIARYLTDIVLYDLTNPETPVATSRIDHLMNSLSGTCPMIGYQNYLYLCNDASLFVLGIDDELQIEELTEINYGENVHIRSDLSIDDQLLYLISDDSDHFRDIYVFSLANPAAPQLINLNFEEMIFGKSISVVDQTAAIIDDSQLQFWDISTNNGTIIGSLQLEDTPYQVYYNNNYAIVYTRNTVLKIDAENPDNPVIVHEIQHENCRGIPSAYDGNRIAYAMWTLGILYLEVGEFGLNVRPRWNDTKSWETSTMMGDKLITGSFGNGFATYEINDDDELVEVNREVPFNIAYSKFNQINDTLAIMYTSFANGPNDSRLITPDEDDPRGFRERGELGSGVQYTTTLYENHIYVYDGSVPNAFCTYDLTDPDEPVYIPGLTFNSSFRGLFIENDHLCVIDNTDLYTYSLDNPAQPQFAGRYTVHLNHYAGFTHGNNHAYLNEQSDIHVISLEDPSNPTLVTDYRPVEYIGRPTFMDYNLGFVLIGRNYNYFGIEGEVDIIDVRNPESPELVGYYTLTGIAETFDWGHFDGNRFFATWGTGVGYFEVDEELMQPPGNLWGIVFDLETGEHLQGVEVFLPPHQTVTNDEGRYFFNDLIPTDYSLYSNYRGYNSHSAERIHIGFNENVRYDFSLTHPELQLDVGILLVEMVENTVTQVTTTIANTGNGPLTATLTSRSFLEEDQADTLWQEALRFELDEQEEDNYGIAYYKHAIWISGANGHDTPQFYQYSRTGEYLSMIPQPQHEPSLDGFFCLASDGDYLYGVDNSLLYQLQLNAAGDQFDVISTIPAPLESPRYLTYDPEDQIFIMGSLNSLIYKIDFEGNVLSETEQALGVRGLGYFKTDETEKPFYFTCKRPFVDDIVINRSANLTDDFEPIFNFDRIDADDTPVSSDITPLSDLYHWMHLMLVDGDNRDYVTVSMLGMNSEWLSVEPSTLEIPDGGESEVTITISDAMIPDPIDFAWLQVEHNAIEQISYLPIDIELIIDNAPELNNSTLSYTWEIGSAYPNPFNSTIQVPFSLPQSGLVEISMFNVLGQLVLDSGSKPYPAGQHTISLSPEKLSSGVYLLRVNVGELSRLQKVIYLR
ncbi:T9SS type A sorting domain-containing protein [bacterium]|nr:T9SS type A sorting domain-containing protein [bacterium]